MFRPVVAVDEDNRVIVAFADNQRGQKLSLAISKAPTRDDWQIFDLTTSAIANEPSIDLSRWLSDGVLSMVYQAQGSSAISVLEWNAQSYFISTTTVDWLGGNASNPADWSTAANWNPGKRPPNGEGYNVRFGNQSADSDVVDISSAGLTVGNITFTNGTNTTIQSTGGHDITVDNFNGNSSIISVEGGSHTIDSPVIIKNDLLITGEGTLDLSGGISGDYALDIECSKVTVESIVVDTLTIASGAKLTVKALTSSQLSGAIYPVPEPSTWIVLALGALSAVISHFSGFWRLKNRTNLA
jgi:hypothetical protein